jgi:hypothetical protein
VIEIPDKFLPWLQADARTRRDNLRARVQQLAAVRAAGSQDEAAARCALEAANELCRLVGADDAAKAAA